MTKIGTPSILSIICYGAIMMSATLIQPQTAQAQVEIYDWHDLKDINNDMTGRYILMNDLDENTDGYDELAGPNANGGEGWLPIGFEDDPVSVFGGIFDGNGHTIRDLFINFTGFKSGCYGVALFACIEDGPMNWGEILNLSVLDADITAPQGAFAAVLVGRVNKGSVENVTVSGSVESSGVHTGGLAGQIIGNGIIRNSHADVELTIPATATSAENVGGLAGFMDDSAQISRSSASGNVNALVGVNAGGLVGELRAYYIENSYATGNVNGQSGYVGGLVGHVHNAQVIHTYATGDVSGNQYCGGLIGVANNGANFRRSFAIGGGSCNAIVSAASGTTTFETLFWDTDMNSSSSGAGNDAIGLGSEEMTGASAEINMQGINSDDAFVMVENGYPEVENNRETNAPEISIDPVASSVVADEGTYPDGLSEAEAIVTVLDSNGNPVNDIGDFGISITFMGNAQVASPWSATGNAGEYRFTISNSYAEVVTVWVSLGQYELNDKPEVEFFGEYAGGSGINTNPYRIENWYHFNNMRSNIGSNYRLMADLDENTFGYEDFAGPDANGGEGWQPFRLNGQLDGDGHTVTGLTINRETESNQALFSELYGDVLNIGLIDVDIKGNQMVAGIAGEMITGLIANTFVTGSIQGNSEVGGFLGEMDDGRPTIRDSYSHADIQGGTNAGGIIGRYNTGNVDRVFATGNVASGTGNGGLFGLYTTVIVNMTNAFWDRGTTNQELGVNSNTFLPAPGRIGIGYGDVSDTGAAAEMTGAAARANMSGLNFSTTFVAVEGGYPELRAVRQTNNPEVDFNVSASTITADKDMYFADGEDEAQVTVTLIDSNGQPVTDINPPLAAYNDPQDNGVQISFSGSSVTVENEWAPTSVDGEYQFTISRTTGGMLGISIGLGGQILEIQPELQFIGQYAGGNGSAGSPYQIENWYQLHNIRDNAGSYFILTADLDENTFLYEDYASPNANSNNGWLPVGTFSGELDGNNLSISDLHINRSDNDRVGLFGTISGGDVYDLNIRDAYVSGRDEVGILSGRLRNTVDISNVFVSGQVEANGYAGGLIGLNDGDPNDGRETTIVRSGAEVTVSVDINFAGGLIGRSINYTPLTVNESFASGSVSAETHAGGFIGMVHESGTISNSYATVDLIMTMNAGSRFGSFAGKSSARLENVFSSGSINIGLVEDENGGIVGQNLNFGEGVIVDSYWDRAATGQSDPIGDDSGTLSNVTGLGTVGGRNPAAEMIGKAAGLHMTALDFNNTFVAVSNGFPELRNNRQTTNPEAEIDPSESEVVVTGTPYANGSDVATVEVKLRDTEGNPVVGITDDFVTLTLGGTMGLPEPFSATGTDGDYQFGITNTADFASSITINVAGVTLDDQPSIQFLPLYAGGDSDADPYQIANWHHLNHVRLNPDANYELIADLSDETDGYEQIAGPDANGGKGFDSIGKLTGTSRDGDPFEGTLDGNGHTIYDLYIKDEMEHMDVEGGIALFSNVYENGVIENLNVLNATVHDHDSSVHPFAILVARLQGTVSNVTVSGEVRSRTNAGGIAGRLDGGIISDSHAEIDIAGWAMENPHNFIGGLVGVATNNDDGLIIRSSVTGTVSGHSAIGGIIGQNGNVDIIESFADVNVSGNTRTGGIAGTFSNPEAMDVYVTGEVNATQDCGYVFGRASFNNTRLTRAYAAVEGNCGGLFGEDGGITVTDSYWATDLGTEGDATSATTTGLTASEMQGASPLRTMDALDLGGAWTLNGNYPRLHWEGVDTPGLILLSDLTFSANSVVSGESLQVEVAAKNVGDEPYSGNITLDIPGGSADSESITLDPAEQETVSIEWNTADTPPGEQSVRVLSEHDQRSGLIEVSADPITVNVRSDETALTNAENFQVTLEFSESVSGFSIGDVDVSGSAGVNIGNLTTEDEQIYTFDVSHESDGIFMVNIPADVATGAYGNGNLALEESFSITLDRTPPEITGITALGGVESPTNQNEFDIRITFNEEISGFEEGKIEIQNATATSFSTTDNIVFDVTLQADEVTSTANTITVDIPMHTFNDLAGNGNKEAETFEIVFGSFRPVAEFTTSANDPTGDSPIRVTLTVSEIFGEPVSGFDAGSITTENVESITLAEDNNPEFELDVVPDGNGPFTVSLTLDEGGVTDAAGNESEESATFTIQFDNNPPGVEITSTEPNPTNADAIPVTLTFSKAVFGFSASDVEITNGTIGNFEGSDGDNVFTADALPENDGPVTVTIPENVVVDLAGNGNVASDSFEILSDRTPPIAEFTSDVNDLVIEPVFEISLTFSEPVFGLKLSGFETDNANLSDLEETGPSGFSLTVRPVKDGLVSVRLPEGAATDKAGNANKPAEFSVIYDTSPPQVDLISPDDGEIDLGIMPEFKWEPADRAETYELQIATGENFQGNNLVKNITGIEGTDYAAVGELEYETNHHWRVRGNNSGVTGEWSEQRTFTTIIQPPSRVALISPVDEADHVDVTPQFEWEKSERAEKYIFELYDLEFSDQPLITLEVEETTFVPEDLLEFNRDFSWRVRGVNRGGNGDWSNFRTFQTTMQIPGRVVLASPEDGAGSASTNPLLEWEATDRAENYRIEISADDQFAEVVLSDDSITETFYQVSDQLDYFQAYYWRVLAENKGGFGDWSETRSFVTEAEVPVAEFPTAGSQMISIAPGISWISAYDGMVAELQVTDDPEHDEFIVDTLTDELFYQITGLIPDQNYYWRVRIAEEATTSSWTDWIPFTTRPDPDQNQQISHRFNFPAIVEGEVASEDYRLMGLPGQNQRYLDEIFSGSYGSDWRAFTDNGSEEDFLIEFASEQHRFHFGQGAGYWAYHREEVDVDELLGTIDFDEMDAVSISVQPGWNIITNPYPREVEWDFVLSFNEIDADLYRYDNIFLTSSVMTPFEGYYFYNLPEWQMDELAIPFGEIYNREGSSQEEDLQEKSRINLTASFGQPGNDVENPPVLSIRYDEEQSEQRHLPYPSLTHARYGLAWEIDEKGLSRLHRALSAEFSSEETEHRLMVKTPYSQRIPLHVEFQNMEDDAAILFISSERHSQLISGDQTAELEALSGTTAYRVMTGSLHDLEEYQQSLLPESITLKQNYPNPFNPTTIIRYALVEQEHVSLEVYDLLGRRVQTLVNEQLTPGWYTVEFNGSSLASGVYLYRLVAGRQIKTGRMMLVK